jgi:hypothetical protein
VDPTHWGSLSCEELLCDCCDDVVYESNPFSFTYSLCRAANLRKS